MQDIFIENIPAIPLFSEPSWGEYNTTRFTNFPNEQNPYAQLSPNNVPENLLVLIELEPREMSPSVIYLLKRLGIYSIAGWAAITLNFYS